MADEKNFMHSVMFFFKEADRVEGIEGLDVLERLERLDILENLESLENLDILESLSAPHIISGTPWLFRS